MAHAPFEIFVPRRHNKGINKKHQVVILGFHRRISDSLRVRNPPSAGCCAQRLCRIFPWTSASRQHPCVPTGGVIVALLTLARTVSPPVRVKTSHARERDPLQTLLPSGSPRVNFMSTHTQIRKGRRRRKEKKHTHTSRRIPPGFA